MDKLQTKIPKPKAKKVILHTIVLCLAILVTIFLVENNYAHRALEYANGFGLFFAAFISGLLFTSIFTTPIAIASLVILGSENNPFVIALIAAIGSVIGDAILLKVIRHDVLEDIEVFTKPFTTPKLKNIFQSKLMFFPLTILAAITLASPLPDELAIALFGAIKFKTHYFYIVSFIFNFVGILIITSAGKLF